MLNLWYGECLVWKILGMLHLWCDISLVSFIFGVMHLCCDKSLVGCIFGELHIWCDASMVCWIFGALHIGCKISLVYCIFGTLHLWCTAVSLHCIFGVVYVHFWYAMHRHLCWCLVGAITIVQFIFGALFLGLGCNIFFVLHLWCYALSATLLSFATAVAHLLYLIIFVPGPPQSLQSRWRKIACSCR